MPYRGKRSGDAGAGKESFLDVGVAFKPIDDRATAAGVVGGSVIDWLLLVIGVIGFVYVVAHARKLADRPRRRTELRPLRRAWSQCLLHRFFSPPERLLDLIGR